MHSTFCSKPVLTQLLFEPGTNEVLQYGPAFIVVYAQGPELQKRVSFKFHYKGIPVHPNNDLDKIAGYLIAVEVGSKAMLGARSCRE